MISHYSQLANPDRSKLPLTITQSSVDVIITSDELFKLHSLVFIKPSLPELHLSMFNAYSMFIAYL